MAYQLENLGKLPVLIKISKIKNKNVEGALLPNQQKREIEYGEKFSLKKKESNAEEEMKQQRVAT